MRTILALAATVADAKSTEKLTFANNPFIPADTVGPTGERRYSQFKTIFQHFYTNEQLTKTYGYGCYCLNLGDRPLSGIMTGVEPVDKKDHHCFQFTRCNRCVTFDYGPDCTPEQIDYKFDIDENTDVVTCLDPENTCARAICECDKHTITTFASVIDFYDPINHAFNGFEPENDCTLRPKPPASGPAQMDCCGEYPNRRPYNKNSDTNFNCCDGKVTSDNQCINSSFN